MGLSETTAGDDRLLLARLHGGDTDVLEPLFARYRARLERTLRIRLDRRLRGRVQVEVLVEEVFREATRHIAEYQTDGSVPFFIWLRRQAARVLQAAQRRELGELANAGDRVSLQDGALPAVSCAQLASMLVRPGGDDDGEVLRADAQLRLEDVLNRFDALDCEIIALRHFEELSLSEVAQVLSIPDSVVSGRYVRAMKRLKKLLDSFPTR